MTVVILDMEYPEDYDHWVYNEIVVTAEVNLPRWLLFWPPRQECGRYVSSWEVSSGFGDLIFTRAEDGTLVRGRVLWALRKAFFAVEARAERRRFLKRHELPALTEGHSSGLHKKLANPG